MKGVGNVRRVCNPVIVSGLLLAAISPVHGLTEVEYVVIIKNHITTAHNVEHTAIMLW